MYDQITSKLVEVIIIISHKFSPMQVATVVTSFLNEHVVTNTKEPKLIKGGAKLAIVSYTLFLPIESMEILVVVVNI
jgi:hypothetical protein